MNHFPYMQEYNDFNLNITDIVSVCHQQMQNAWTYNPQLEDHCQLHFICKGSLEAVYNGEALTVPANSLLYIPANTDYHAQSKVIPYEYFCIYFCMEPLKNSSVSIPIVFFPKSTEKYLNYYEAAKKAWRYKRFGYILQIKAILYDIFRVLLAEHLTINFISKGYQSIEPAVHYIEHHYHKENLQISNLAQLCNITPNHFIRLFKEHFSVTPKQYVNQLRIEHASELLRLSSISIDEISRQMGFSEVSYFSKAFKHIMGESPLQYRKNIYK